MNIFVFGDFYVHDAGFVILLMFCWYSDLIFPSCLNEFPYSFPEQQAFLYFLPFLLALAKLHNTVLFETL